MNFKQWLILTESSAKRGQKIKVSWKLGRDNKVNGNANDINKIIFPERGSEKFCCLFHRGFQDAIVKHDTQPASESKGAIIVQPIPCQKCQELHQLIPNEIQYKFDKGTNILDRNHDNLFLKHNNKEKELSLDDIYPNWYSNNYEIDKEKLKKEIDNLKNASSIDDTIEKIKKGDIQIPSFPKGIMDYPENNVNTSEFEEYKTDFPANIDGHLINKIRTKFIKKTDDGKFIEISNPKVTLYESNWKDTGGPNVPDVLSPDERSYRSGGDSYEELSDKITANFDEIPELIEKHQGFRSQETKKHLKEIFANMQKMKDKAPEIVKQKNNYIDSLEEYQDWKKEFIQWAKNLPDKDKIFYTLNYNITPPKSIAELLTNKDLFSHYISSKSPYF